MKKKQLLILAFACIGLSASAQSRYAPAIAAATQMNIVYKGIQNPLAIVVPGYKQDSLIVKVNHGTLKKSDERNMYVWSTTDSLPPRELIVSVSVKVIDNVIWNAGDITFRVRQIPNPELMFGTFRNGDSISLPELKSVNNVFANIEGFPFQGLSFTVTKYTIVYQPKKGDAIVKYVNGHSIIDILKKMFENAQSGDRVIIGNASAINNNNGETVGVTNSVALNVK